MMAVLPETLSMHLYNITCTYVQRTIVCRNCGLKICCIYMCVRITLTFNSTVWPELHGRGLKICCIFFYCFITCAFPLHVHPHLTWLSSIPCTVIGHYLKIKPTRTNVYMCTCVHMFIIYYIITLLLYYMYMLLSTWQPLVCVVSDLCP